MIVPFGDPSASLALVSRTKPGSPMIPLAAQSLID